jgi:hypothetical protein
MSSLGDGVVVESAALLPIFVFERHRFAEFVIYSDFDCVEFSTSDEYVMGLDVGVSHRVAVFAGDVAVA